MEKISYVLVYYSNNVSPTNSSNLPECEAHTSEAVVNSRAVMLSIAIHLRGRRPLVFFTYTSSTSRERPKSVIFKSLSLATRTLRQAKSRWTILKLAKYSCTPHEEGREGGREGGREETTKKERKVMKRV